MSLTFTSACRQKNHHVKFAVMHQSFANTISYTINDDNFTIVYATNNS